MIVKLTVLFTIALMAILLPVMVSKVEKLKHKKRLKKFEESICNNLILPENLILPCKRYGGDIYATMLFYHVKNKTTDISTKDTSINVDIQKIAYDNTLLMENNTYSIEEFMTKCLESTVVDELISSHAGEYMKNHHDYAMSFDFNKKLCGKVWKFNYTRNFHPNEKLTYIGSFTGSYLSYIFIGHPMSEDGKCIAGGTGFDICDDAYSIEGVTQEEFNKWKKAVDEFDTVITKNNGIAIPEPKKLICGKIKTHHQH